MILLEFIFQSFWHFAGCVVIIHYLVIGLILIIRG